MSIEPLTDQEIEFLKANPVFARHAIAIAVQAAETPVYRGSGDPMDVASFHLSNSMAKRLGYLKKRLVDLHSSHAESGGSVATVTPALRERAAKRRQERINVVQSHIAGLERKLANLQAGATEMFLPLGAIVRFKRPCSHALALDNVDMPAEGTIGVVTELKRQGDFAVGVAIFDNYTTENGVSCLAGDRSFESFAVDADMLDVVEYAKLPDGSEFKGFGYLPTYADAQSSDLKDGHMVLATAGRYFSFGIKTDEYGREHGVEIVSIDDSLWGSKWLGDPITYEPENSTSTMKM
ncbi:hypothetical protein [Mesorhizobium sp. SP-1A]|uniref:hypothetical protein n=1 Tax=Mesorhizobium sp. SP-1A TaxID=3077840 RepID=UPI0028F6CCAA|nr:hypothetical protein [Mesorhizobium sp. SP-1A]